MSKKFVILERIFPLASVSRPALGPTQPPVQWVPEVLFPELKRGRGVTLTTHPYLVPRSRMSRSYTSSPTNAIVACSDTAFVQYTACRRKMCTFLGDLSVQGRTIIKLLSKNRF
jgi:hypothetical protein